HFVPNVLLACEACGRQKVHPTEMEQRTAQSCIERYGNTLAVLAAEMQQVRIAERAVQASEVERFVEVPSGDRNRRQTERIEEDRLHVDELGEWDESWDVRRGRNFVIVPGD